MEGAVSYNIYVNGTQTGTTVATDYTLPEGLLKKAGTYEISVVPVNADGVEGTPATITYEVRRPENLEERMLSYQNLATGKSVTASSTTTPNGYQPEEAVDGNFNSMWGAATSGKDEWLAVELGETTDIGSVAIVWEGAYAAAYEIQVSNDGKSYDTVKSVTADKPETIEIVLPEGTTARYVRIYATEPGTGWEMKIKEVGVFGPEDVPETTTEEITTAADSQESTTASAVDATTDNVQTATDGQETTASEQTTDATDVTTSVDTTNDVPGQPTDVSETTKAVEPTSGADVTEPVQEQTTGAVATTKEVEVTTTKPTETKTVKPTSPITTKPTQPTTKNTTPTTRQDESVSSETTVAGGTTDTDVAETTSVSGETTKVTVARAKVKKATKKLSSKKIKLKLKKLKNITGYQIQISKKKKFKKKNILVKKFVK